MSILARNMVYACGVSAMANAAPYAALLRPVSLAFAVAHVIAMFAWGAS